MGLVEPEHTSVLVALPNARRKTLTQSLKPCSHRIFFHFFLPSSVSKRATQHSPRHPPLLTSTATFDLSPMAVTDYLEGMSDPRLKPRLLRSLVRDRLPEENRPDPGPSELSSILASVKTQGLLSERVFDPSDTKLVEAWRTAVDAWVERLLSLVSSIMPDKCWVGVCLLGVSCEECSSVRFMSSYSLWFQKLLLIIQLPSSSSFVRLAVCAALSDLFTRLAGFSKLKKDATAFAGKIVQSVLQLLNENESDAVLEGVLDLLYVILSFFPSSVHRHYDDVEAVLVSKILSSRFNADLLKKIAYCLALLPRVRGDEDAWSVMMQKIIIEIDMLLDDALQGLEGELKGSTVVRLLIPPGRDPPPQLGLKLRLKEAPVEAIKRFRELVVPTVSTLIHCCYMMLTNPYPIQVTVPVRPLIALVERVLMVDGLLRGSITPFTTVMNQELVCYELPALHLDTLDLLVAITKGARSQLLPHGAIIARIIIEYSRKATLLPIRIKVYSVMQFLLISTGLGMVLYLAQELINNAFADLTENTGSTLLPAEHSLEEAGQVLLQNSPRKRKRGSGSSRQHSNGTDKEDAITSIKPGACYPVKIAALKALDALLTVGGSLRSECWRTDMDYLLITVAKNACDVGWAYECNSSIAMVESTVSRTDFQLAALQALLAALLSPSYVRPPYLSEGLELFRRGKLEAGTKVAAFCAHALLALEVLIHPRALPLVDIQGSKTIGEGFNQRYPGNMFYSSQKPNVPAFTMGNLGARNEMDGDDDDDDDDDDELNGWFGAGEEERPVQLLKTSISEKPAGVGSERVQQTMKVSQEPLKKHEVEISCTSKEINMDEPNKADEHNSRIAIIDDCDKPSSDEGNVAVQISTEAMVTENVGASMSDTMEGKFPGNSGVPSVEVGTVSNEMMPADNASKTLDVSDKGKDSMLTYDSDSGSLNSLPDIVDADPDTD
ncbi:proline-, glutamic acid- and leucine-rich protein 1 [Canna indica]|uniref:Proline-, glutamic acid- and leucine-rich protein 1 n=1 Tax=Canna indica TaxID=4628 RepID=A0AAQ3L1P8_9LILI|nr:proline-, glutamic acid- and leucine-rich protein 1 [Canna indica]